MKLYYWHQQRLAVTSLVGRYLGHDVVLQGIDRAQDLYGRRDEIFIDIVTHYQRVPAEVHQILQRGGWIVWNIDDSASRRRYAQEQSG